MLALQQPRTHYQGVSSEDSPIAGNSTRRKLRGYRGANRGRGNGRGRERGGNRSPSVVNTITEINLMSTPPIKDYDIVPDIWNAPAKVTVGELLANPQYRAELLTAINTIENREPRSNVNNVSKTTALFMRVRINEHKTKVIPDSGVVVSI